MAQRLRVQVAAIAQDSRDDLTLRSDGSDPHGTGVGLALGKLQQARVNAVVIQAVVGPNNRTAVSLVPMEILWRGAPASMRTDRDMRVTRL
jgi:hypothetical protein